MPRSIHSNAITSISSRRTLIPQGEEHVDILPQEGADSTGANKTRITTRFLTKYERARILGTRALQIRWVRAWAEQRGLLHVTVWFWLAVSCLVSKYLGGPDWGNRSIQSSNWSLISSIHPHVIPSHHVHTA